MKHLNTVAFVWLLLAAAVWCFFEIQAIAEITGKMIGFHPLVFLAVPVGVVMSVLCFAMSPIRNRLAALCVAIVPAAALFAPIYFGFNILVFAWSDAIQQTAATNEVAIKVQISRLRCLKRSRTRIMKGWCRSKASSGQTQLK